ncbi:MAG: hypothetical protein E7641_03215 [Ruminococcaceae bacterium]|nr:hypothetical protein [Oscillospiraceae bacterium]
MKTSSKIIWGIILVALGVVIALNAFGVTDIDIFFDGWWTLFIIVPCLVGLFGKGGKMGNLLGLAIGIFLLLYTRDILDFATIKKLIFPAIVVVIGLGLLLGGIFGGKASKMASKIFDDMKKTGKDHKVGCATFSSVDLNADGEVFEGAELVAAFGSVKYDLRGAIIEKDAAISVSATFGGITILLPEGVNVRVTSNSLFGGISSSNKKKEKKCDGPTVYVSGSCIFGGVDIK